ncbi:hypothetical protein C8F04DRAFT_1174595 [Mycena alexandri]|uniref:Uncharacterized protein n=1 Tax=Mycena alexandri TaxID=1745969 RepID=A0AAD6TFP6_9AGAR|nr:hypothetical protein C8F04DRAFT_1174595 [Mycena alexandri]
MPAPAPFSLIRAFLVSFWVVSLYAYSHYLSRLTWGPQNDKRVIVDSLPGGPVGYLGILAQWDHVFSNVIYATQSILGDAVAVYRCWVLWNRNFFVVCLPFLLFFGSAVSGYMVCAIFAKIQVGSTVFDISLDVWIKTFFTIAVAQNIITTGLMAWRIAATDRKASSYRTGQGNLIPILRILVESAALYLTAELILLILYVANNNAQFILLESITPIVGITFNAITIPITLRSQRNLSSDSWSRNQTIGSMPLRSIAVNITRTNEMQYDVEGQSGKGQDAGMV